VRDIAFDRDTIRVPALSIQHFREMTERTAGPLLKLVELLSAADPQKLAGIRRESTPSPQNTSRTTSRGRTTCLRAPSRSNAFLWLEILKAT